MTFKDFNAGDIFTADDADLLLRQGIIAVADQAARDAIPLPSGLRVYRVDAKVIEAHNGIGWVRHPDYVVVADQAARDALPSPVAGMRAFRLDIKAVDTYDGAAWQPGDTGWVDLLPYFTPGAAVGLTSAWGRRLNGIVSFTGVANGAIPTGITNVLTGIPAIFRPSIRNQWGSVYTSAADLLFVVRTDGTAAFSNNSGAARSNGQFSNTFIP